MLYSDSLFCTICCPLRGTSNTSVASATTGLAGAGRGEGVVAAGAGLAGADLVGAGLEDAGKSRSTTWLGFFTTGSAVVAVSAVGRAGGVLYLAGGQILAGRLNCIRSRDFYGCSWLILYSARIRCGSRGGQICCFRRHWSCGRGRGISRNHYTIYLGLFYNGRLLNGFGWSRFHRCLRFRRKDAPWAGRRRL